MSNNSTLRARLAHLAAARLEQVEILADMDVEYAATLEELNEIRYPILNLPAEVVSEIFVHCLPKETVDVVSTRDAPILLCRICRRWRQIALSTLRLWTTFTVVVESESQKAQLADIAQTWLSRTGGFPLTISLRGHLSQAASFDRFMQILQQRANNIRSLILRVPRFDLNEVGKHIQAFPALEEISIHAARDNQNPPLISMFRESRHLRTVTLESIPLAALQLQTNRISELVGIHFSTGWVQDALRDLPNAVKCSFAITNEEGTSLDEPLTLPRLRSLELHFAIFSGGVTSILEFLNLPVLHSLSIRGLTQDRLDDPIVEEFFRRSASSLRDLDISGLLSFTVPPVRIFRLLNSITALRFGSPVRTRLAEFFNALATDGDFLPMLENFGVVCADRFDDGDQADFLYVLEKLGHALATRRETVPGYPWLLDSVEVSADVGPLPAIPEERLLEFRMLRELGVTVHVGGLFASVL
ncbi:hypothetical protein C8F01DRAFT_1115218 [Mycena amicta]|nr:hypothetical protein C8F01DRAFT_1115218 [Mycena amicta]